MPHDLFGEVAVRPPSIGPRRTRVVVLSVAAHGIVITTLLVVPLLAVGALPVPQRALEFFAPVNVVPAVVVPPPPHPASGTPRAAERVMSPGVAPLVAPSTIAPETGFENAESSNVVLGPPAADVIENMTAIGREKPAPVAPAPVAPVRLHAGIDAPRKLYDVAPIYPAIARAAHVQGIVIIEATIDTTGNVESTRVLRSIPLLDQAALDAVRQWKFTPALLNGTPVPIIMTVTVNFALQ